MEQQLKNNLRHKITKGIVTILAMWCFIGPFGLIFLGPLPLPIAEETRGKAALGLGLSWLLALAILICIKVCVNRSRGR